MPLAARYGHTNIIAADWRVLARFYQEVFGCVPVPPERDFHGAPIESATGIPSAHVRGIHLRLPGHGDNGPTLEILNYTVLADRPATAANRPGFGHMAFIVDDMGAARQAVLDGGGCAVGDVATLELADSNRVTICYMTDPEGNIVELQVWSR
jgi:catechol 2,3-dioxygenase-like lactoylglutathione lyase family enzyme